MQIDVEFYNMIKIVFQISREHICIDKLRWDNEVTIWKTEYS